MKKPTPSVNSGSGKQGNDFSVKAKNCEEENPHQHPHAHSHHGHSHERELLPIPHASYGKLKVSFWIIAIFMVLETTCGWIFNSLALISDGAHMLTDAVALGVAAFAVSMGTRRATKEKTFGFKRFEILAAFANGLTLVLISGIILFHALGRIFLPEAVDAWPMLWVASMGFLVNLFVAWRLHRGEDVKSLNMEGVMWHIMGDLGGSLAAILAAVGILLFGWIWVDPALSMVMAGILCFGGIRVMRKSSHILVEGTPEGIEIALIRGRMLASEQVQSVHDLHLWTMNGRDLYLSAHVEISDGKLSEKDVTQSLTSALASDYGVNHITLQVGHCVDGDCWNNCEDEAGQTRRV